MVSNSVINLFLFLMGGKQLSTDWTMTMGDNEITLHGNFFNIVFNGNGYIINGMSVPVDELSDVVLARFNLLLRENTVITNH